MKKYIPTFAEVHAKNYLFTFVVSVFFYAQNIGYQIPAYYTTAKYVMVLGRTGGDSLSYYYSVINFQTQMPRAKKIETNVKHSNVTSTPTERNTVSSLEKIIHNLLSYAEPQFYREIIEELLEIFIISEYAVDDKTRKEAWFVCKELSSFFRLLEKCKDNE